ncbi:universal stress protein [Natronorubrum thiooxidans]|uniref:Nucleotide-binding universal stress protein, UspA family n=1 Tax=Natronorubrum thiooxidans TaxID=308853 RepID=A0A1N7H5I9_9EURY|nr:universal stress protein [Natronorubrum thiooxidans]SIS19928.1 Nucleotide-binding universal stress protein, UspA family [Natronorubrum thiooxidans]
MTIETLLIPTDGSDPAETAAQRGFDLAAQCDATVHVLSVADSSIATGAGYSGDSQSIRDQLRKQATARATSLRDAATERGLEATAITREGIPSKEIVDYADEHAIDAIAIGTSGRGGVTRAVVGSVADKVIRTAPVPVVTTTPKTATAADEETTVDSILLPTDGSDTAETVVQRGFALAAKLDATVHLLSVINNDRAQILSALADADVDIADELREQATDVLDELAAEAQALDVDVVTTTRNGVPAEGIVDYADTEGIDLIAMGTAGRGGFERALVGSVTDEVVRTAVIPVLTVRPDSDRLRADNESH